MQILSPLDQPRPGAPGNGGVSSRAGCPPWETLRNAEGSRWGPCLPLKGWSSPGVQQRSQREPGCSFQKQEGIFLT